MAMSCRPFDLDPTDAGLPRPNHAERLADAALHALGLALGLVACATLGFPAIPRAEPALRAALALYAAGLVAMFACSALHNLAPGGSRRRGLFRRLDQAAIFLFIAGTHTPFALLAGDGWQGAGLLAFVWAAAGGGAAAKLAGLRAPAWLTTGAYLALGWSAAAMLGPLSAALPPAGLGLLVAGGALYSLGVVVHLRERLPYRAAVWHGFVLAAAACHYGAVREVAALATVAAG
jgi:hemolysin III